MFLPRLSRSAFLLLLAGQLLAGCATLEGRKQGVLVDSVPEDAQILDSEGHQIGTTPGLVEIHRGRHASLRIEGAGEHREIPLAGHYRWRDSFLSNLVFLTAAPIGWITDLATGAAWEYPVDVNVTLNDQAAPPTAHSHLPTPEQPSSRCVAIAPPRAPSTDVSDEAGPAIERQLRSTRHREYRILPYAETARFFLDAKIDGLKTPDVRQLTDVGENLGSCLIFVSELQDGQDGEDPIPVRGVFHQPGHSDGDREINLELRRAELPSLEEEEDGHGKFAGFSISGLPNSLFLDFGASRSTFSVNQQITHAVPHPTNDFVGFASEYLSALSLRRMVPPSQRDIWRFSFEFSPTSSFSRARERLESFPSLADVDFTRTHLDVGYGGTASYGSRSFSFYLSFFEVLGYNRIATEVNGRQVLAEAVGPGAVIEFGMLYYFHRRWVLRFYSRSAEVPSQVWSDAIRDATGQQTRFDSTNLITSGIAFGYIFANKDLPYRR